MVQVLGVLLQGGGFFILFGRSFFGLSLGLARFNWLRRVILLDPMGNEVDHIEPGHPLLVQVVNGMGVFFAKNGHQHICSSDLFLAAPGRLHMHDGTLYDPLKTKRWLGVNVISASHLGRVVFDEVGQGLAEIVDVCRAGAQNLGSAGVVEQGLQQVLHSDEFVTLLARLDKCHVEADF